MRFLFLLLLVGIPAAEIALFIKVGGWIGVLPTILLVFVMSAFGAALLRRQGLQSFIKAQGAMQRGEAPVDDMLDGFFLVLAGILFILPGFLSDILGFALLLSPVRNMLAGQLRRRFNVQTVRNSFYSNGHPGDHTAGNASGPGGPIIDGKAEEIHDEIDPKHRLPPKS